MASVRKLMKRGEREVAAYIKKECFGAAGETQLNELLDFLLDHNKPLEDDELIRWCRALIAGGCTFEEFSKTVSSYDDAAVCGLIWKTNAIAYRCWTCATSHCMSLCPQCFHAADHAGHDFNVYRSYAGGACDCGDVSVMNSVGFCPKHGPDRPKQSVPNDLLLVPSMMVPRLIIRLIQYMKDHYSLETHGNNTVSMSNSESFVNMLQQLSDMGAAMKSVITKATTDTQVYQQFIDGECLLTRY